VKVVSNTSPLTSLAAINQFDLLRLLYTEVSIAEAVWDELNAHGRRWPGRDEVAAATWVRRCTVANRHLVQALQRDLDRGEAETIALALELKADIVLLDEQEGRHAAQRLGLKTIGVIGVLMEARQRHHVKAVRPLLDSLRNAAGFYLSDSLYARVLELAGEAEDG
jgi:uncharacterized protein